MLKWKDVSSYSHYEKPKVPKTFSVDLKGCKVAITRHIHYNKEDWVLVSDLFHQRVISTGTADEAKEAAVKYVRVHLQAMLDQLD